MKKTEDEKTAPIIIKRVKKSGGGGHHGGAWKVAYADFVTAMMAFFLLLWLLNVTTEEQKFAISNYFDPTFPKVSNTQSGAGGVMGGTSVSPDGSMTTTVQPITQPNVPDTARRGNVDNNNSQHSSNTEVTPEQAEDIARRAETKNFEAVENQIRQSLEANPELKELTTNLLMDITPEGLRIQIVDQDNSAMFASGSAQMFEKTRKLMELVAKAVAPLPNKLSVRGHTDSEPYPAGNTYDNWELSADRANSSRRALMSGGLPAARIANVTGKADTDHLDKANPMAPINRRISIILMRQDKPPMPKAKARTAVPGRWDKYATEKDKETQPGERKEPAQPFRSGGGVLGLPE